MAGVWGGRWRPWSRQRLGGAPKAQAGGCDTRKQGLQEGPGVAMRCPRKPKAAKGRSMEPQALGQLPAAGQGAAAPKAQAWKLWGVPCASRSEVRRMLPMEGAWRGWCRGGGRARARGARRCRWCGWVGGGGGGVTAEARQSDCTGYGQPAEARLAGGCAGGCAVGEEGRAALGVVSAIEWVPLLLNVCAQQCSRRGLTSVAEGKRAVGRCWSMAVGILERKIRWVGKV